MEFIMSILTSIIAGLLGLLGYYFARASRRYSIAEHRIIAADVLDRVFLRMPGELVRPLVDLQTDFWHLFASLSLMGYPLPLDSIGIYVRVKRITDFSLTLASAGIECDDTLTIMFFFGKGGTESDRGTKRKTSPQL